MGHRAEFEMSYIRGDSDHRTSPFFDTHQNKLQNRHHLLRIYQNTSVPQARHLRVDRERSNITSCISNPFQPPTALHEIYLYVKYEQEVLSDGKRTSPHFADNQSDPTIDSNSAKSPI